MIFWIDHCCQPLAKLLVVSGVYILLLLLLAQAPSSTDGLLFTNQHKYHANKKINHHHHANNYYFKKVTTRRGTSHGTPVSSRDEDHVGVHCRTMRSLATRACLQIEQQRQPWQCDDDNDDHDQNHHHPSEKNDQHHDNQHQHSSRRNVLLSTTMVFTATTTMKWNRWTTPTAQAFDMNINNNDSNNNKMTTTTADATTSTPTSSIQPSAWGQKPMSRRSAGLASKIRAVTFIMDELQRDLMQEKWDLVEPYPAQLRSYVPVFTTYTDSAFPTDAPTDKGLRVALRYEVGRFFACVERFKQAAQRRSLDEAYLAYAEMSLHIDRYLRVGGLYGYYDDTVSTEPYFQGISDDDLVYSNPKKDPPLVRDLVILIKGPDKGKTGIIIGKYNNNSSDSSNGRNNNINTIYYVKLDRYKGVREIRVVSSLYVAKRLGEQDPDDVFMIPRKDD